MAVKQNNAEGGSSSSAATSQNVAKNNNQKKTYEISTILDIIDMLITKQQEGEISNGMNLITCNCHLIIKLSKVALPREPEEIKKFTQDILKVGEFLAKVGDQNQTNTYLQYLRVVCGLITAEEPPSCAIAIVFQLFPEDLITKAVSLVLSSNENASDEEIKRTVNVLCNWLRTCLFCQNLNIWILAILNGLREQQKYELLFNIAMDVIEPLFISLLLPVLRPKVAPIVFHILSSVKHTPEVFHKIIGKAPPIIKQLKKEDKKILQTMGDLLAALMTQFQGYDELYKQTEEVLLEFSPSFDYRAVLNYPSWSLPGKAVITNPRAGLMNLGNTCYMNSILQALAMTKEFSREILLSCSKTPILGKIQELLALMLHSSRSELTPSTVLHATRPPWFVPGFQQDSSEFLGFLLEMLHEQESTFHKGTQKLHLTGNDESRNMEADTTDFDEEGATSCNFSQAAGNQSLTEDTRRKETTIEKTFAGKIATTYKCLTCGWQSKNTDSFRDLQLAFPEVKTDCASNYSVQDLLDYYCSPEKLYGDNQYFCEKCKKLTDAERFINVVSAPKNLILTLKHFKYDQRYHMRAKLMHKVFHDESVSLKVYSPETLNEIASVNYNLYAAVVHSGFSMDSGHYYTYASDGSDNWYKFNDNIVTSCSMSELHNLNTPNTPYILFYQMKSRHIEDTSDLANMIVPIEAATLPSLEELPPHLRDYVNRDNSRVRQLNATSPSANISLKNKGGGNNDRDDEPPSTCGGNALNCVNRFIF